MPIPLLADEFYLEQFVAAITLDPVCVRFAQLIGFIIDLHEYPEALRTTLASQRGITALF